MTSEGLRPGCDDERARPNPRLDAVLDDMDAVVSFCPIMTAAEDGSVGEGELVLDGAEVFDRLCEMVPIAGDRLINCDCVDDSDRTDKVEDPLGLGAIKLDELGDGGTRSIARLEPALGPEAQGVGDGKAGKGESLLSRRDVSGTRFLESVAASISWLE